MGRFYETSQPHFIDNKMYQAPAELMANVIMNKEKAVDDTIASANSYLEKLKAESLIQDTPALQKRIADYEGKISGIVENIQANPMEYNKYTGDITKLGRDISADWTTGPIGTMQNNKKKAEAEIQILNDHLKAHPEDANYVAIKKKEIFSGYENGLGYNDATKQSTGTLKVDGTYYHPEFDDKFLAQMKAKGKKVERDSVSGAWINTSSDDNKILTQGEIQQAYLAAAGADVNYQTALNDWSASGVAGYEDVDINRAYNTSVNKKGQQVQTINPDNFFGRKAQAAGIAYEVKEQDTRRSIKVNSHYEWQQEQYAKTQSDKTNLLGSVSKNIVLTKKKDLLLVNQKYNDALNSFAFDTLKMPRQGAGKEMSVKGIKEALDATIAKMPEGSIEAKKLREQYTQIGKLYTERLNIGYGATSEVLGVAATVAIQKAVGAYTEDPANLYGVKGDFDIRNRAGKTIHVKNKSFYDIKNNPELYGFTEEDFSGVTEADATTEETKTTIGGARRGPAASKNTKAKRTGDYFVKGSEMPIILTDNPSQFHNNKNSFEFEVNGVPLHFVTTFNNLGIRVDTD
jgi:hypothetical protein